MLDRLSHGCSFGEAISEAQHKGFAERDPGQDVSGKDAACKLVVIAAVAFNVVLDLDDVKCEGIAKVTPEAATRARLDGSVPRLVAQLRRTGGGWRGRVAPRVVNRDDPLASAREEDNVVVVRSAGGNQHVLRGKGAGRWPTTIAVVADLLDVHHQYVQQITQGVSIP